jgi:hypothetical protein
MRMPHETRLERVTRVARAHAHAEASGDLEGCLATLVPDPRYEFHPLGLAMRGPDLVRRFYQNYFAEFVPRVAGYELLSEWVSEAGVAQEYDISLRVDGVAEHYRVLGVLTPNADGNLLSGERLYASEGFVRRMGGDAVFAALTPLARD